jgi:hypothetical protein
LGRCPGSCGCPALAAKGPLGLLSVVR